MSLFSGFIHPIASPAPYVPCAIATDLLDLHLGIERLVEEVMLRLWNCLLPHVYGAVGGRIAVFEDTIVAHKPHHAGDIMTIEGLNELKDDADRRF
jgi:hypothetical protein